VGEFGGHGNVAAITVALLAVLAGRGLDGTTAYPWYFPTPDAYRARLERHGFAVERIELVPRPTPLPTGMSAWLDTFAEPFLGLLPEDERAAAKDGGGRAARAGAPGRARRLGRGLRAAALPGGARREHLRPGALQPGARAALP
jgi:hypothetical protein